MDFLHDPEFGDKLVTLLAAFVLVLQISMVGQRSLIMNIRVFGTQSFLLASIAGAIAWYNGARPYLHRRGDDGAWSRPSWFRCCWNGWWNAWTSAMRSSPSLTCRSPS